MQIDIAKQDLPIALQFIEDGRRLEKIILKQNRHLIDSVNRIKVADKLIVRLQRAIEKG